MDIGFVVDASCSIGDYGWDQTLASLEDFISILPVGPESIRVAMVTFQTYAEIRFDLDV